MQLLFKQLIISVMQNLLFCVPKAAVLHGKSVGFASQKGRFRNANKLSCCCQWEVYVSNYKMNVKRN